MNLKQLIELLTNRVNRITSDIAVAQQLGDIERVIQLETESAETQNTILQLKSIEG